MSRSNKDANRPLLSHLVETDDVRSSPCSGTENDLDLLTTRETSHGVVADELSLETKVGKVLLDLTTNKRAEETKTLSFTSVELDDFLFMQARQMVSGTSQKDDQMQCQTFSKPRVISSSRESQMFSVELRFLNETSYS